ncbi:hypothetical protein BV25DRAFT_1791899 [Artomyces pyxidatus]|uniref:Uncharacterized protein n=1 Tax=Artomyces pyxidatus TaxID=48021 RepID=A0ACB8TJE1_9AGAM|nr:hypothetical protein BV25DRAFT_1791899 [Artomyces pyxidatus]
MPDILIHGFYRHTDIWYEWHQALPNQEDGQALKAILSFDALVHPDHPLRLEGKKGIELSIGTLQNGEARLLFTSAQVEYIRYWLHATGLTKELIPLPYSDCLLTKSSLQNWSPVIYKTGGELRSANKVIEKNNRRLKGTDTALAARRLAFERVRALWAEKQGVWCSLDFEAWDLDHKVLTEFGWSLARWEDGKEVEEMGHLIVKEHQYYTNQYVPEHRHRYNFGTSEIVSRKEFKTRINDLLDRISTPGPLFLVFHDNSQDVKYLRSESVQAPLANLSYLLPDSCAATMTADDPGLFVIDTAELFAALEGDSSGAQKRSLERVCRHLQIPTDYLHNAGNDARYTHLALISMASGDPLDIQREKRWPNHTQGATGPAVKFSKVEEDSEASDDEGDGGDGPYDMRTGRLREDWMQKAQEKAQLDGKPIDVEVDVKGGEGVVGVNGQVFGKPVKGSNEH